MEAYEECQIFISGFRVVFGKGIRKPFWFRLVLFRDLQGGNMENLLVIFVKYPEPHRVKTRLGREIGYVEAARLYEKMVINQISDLTCDGYDLAFYVDDRHDIASYKKKFGGEGAYFYQKGPDLGERMGRAITESFQRNYSRVILMGSDIPLVDASAIKDFFNHLFIADMIIGPAVDGGYYLIGFRNNIHIAPVFKNIVWGSAGVFQQTMTNAADLKVQVEKTWFDIDTGRDLEIYQTLLRTGGKFSGVTSSVIRSLYALC